MEVVQLQLDLWQSLETAAQFPETADVRSLCWMLELSIAEQPLNEQLQKLQAKPTHECGGLCL
jgi:hypothetical protein